MPCHARQSPEQIENIAFLISCSHPRCVTICAVWTAEIAQYAFISLFLLFYISFCMFSWGFAVTAPADTGQGKYSTFCIWIDSSHNLDCHSVTVYTVHLSTCKMCFLKWTSLQQIAISSCSYQHVTNSFTYCIYKGENAAVTAFYYRKLLYRVTFK